MAGREPAEEEHGTALSLCTLSKGEQSLFFPEACEKSDRTEIYKFCGDCMLEPR